MSSSDPLDPAVLIHYLPNFLPEGKKRLDSSWEGLAALFHTAMAELGFRLIAADEFSRANPNLHNVLPHDWTRCGPGNYAFRYKHDQSCMEFSLKVTSLASRTLLHAFPSEVRRRLRLHRGNLFITIIQGGGAASLDICTEDFSPSSFFPYVIGSDKPLVKGFEDCRRVADLMSQFKSQIVSRILRGLHKEGYVEQSEAAPTSERPVGTQQTPGNYPGVGPRAENPPRAPVYPNAYNHHYPPIPPQYCYPTNPYSPTPLFPRPTDYPIYGIHRPFGESILPHIGAHPQQWFDGAVPGPSTGSGQRLFQPPTPGQGVVYGPNNDIFLPP